MVVKVDVFIASEKVTDKLDEASTQVALSAGVIDEIVGAVVSTVKEVIVNVFPAFPEESVTLIVQLE